MAEEENQEAVKALLADCELLDVDPKELYPNPWNPNRMTEIKYLGLKESVRKYPQILKGQRVIVRQKPTEEGKYQILNGEHRWRICIDLHHKTVPIGNLGKIGDAEAKLISLALANVGELDFDKKLAIIKDINKTVDIHIAKLEGGNKEDGKDST